MPDVFSCDSRKKQTQASVAKRLQDQQSRLPRLSRGLVSRVCPGTLFTSPFLAAIRPIAFKAQQHNGETAGRKELLFLE
jgi:hypothetical protein